MQAIMLKHPDLVGRTTQASPDDVIIIKGEKPVYPTAPEPQPVAVIAQTPAAQAAMASRQAAINASLSGKVDKETGRPRKF